MELVQYAMHTITMYHNLGNLSIKRRYLILIEGA